jgi:hypothetical protein
MLVSSFPAISGPIVSSQMTKSDKVNSIEALRRKLRAVVAVVEDPAATEHERANAKVLKAFLERRLRRKGAPAGDWTDVLFRIGRTAKEVGHSSASPSPRGDWTDEAFRLGRIFRRGLKKLR